MYPDIDGGAPVPEIKTVTAPAAAPAAAQEDPVKALLIKQQEAIEAQAARIADLSKQLNAIASQQSAAAASEPAPAAEKSPQDQAWEATLAKYFGPKEEE